LYLALALAFWLVPIVGEPGSNLIAADDIDASAFLWMFSWWPHALGHGLEPFTPDVIFAPEGYNLAWASSMPGPSVLLAPVTLALGPEATWNLLAVLAPALGAWTAFLLCRHVTGRVGPSLVGGYVFGFSPFVLGHIAGAPNLATVALVPLAALLVVRRVEGSLSERAFVISLAAVIAAQFLTWVETLALVTFFGAIALALAYWLYPAAREALRRTMLLAAGAYAIVGVLVSPFLYAFAFEPHAEPSQALKDYPADALSWVVPAHYQAVATGHTRAGVPEYAVGYTYLGLPLVVLLAVFVWRYRRRRAAVLLGLCVVIPMIASLGKELNVRGHDTGVPLPWAAFAELPILRYAIPIRFGLFFLLPAAVAVALWLTWARGRTVAWSAWGLAGLSVLFLLPAVGNDLWKTRLTAPAFFEGDAARTLIRDDDRVLTVPTWGESMRWQVDQDFRFDLTGGYLGAFPESYMRYPAFRTVLSGQATPEAPAQLRRFIRDKGVTVIVVDERRPGPWRRLFGTLGVEPVQTQGVLLYRLR